MRITYSALLTTEPVCGFVVRFRDVPEALATGADRDSAMLAAERALATALRHYVVTGRPLPDPSPPDDGEELIEAEVWPEPDRRTVGKRLRAIRRRVQPWRRLQAAATDRATAGS